MDRTARDLSLALDGVAKALAEWAVVRQGELDPSLAGRFGSAWRGEWVADTQVRLRHLAQAIAVRRPALFAEMVEWSAGAFTARRMELDDLRRNLKCLAEVVRERLPEAVAEAAVACLDEGARRLGEAGVRPSPEVREPPLDELALRYLEAILSGRRREAETLILEAAEAGRPVRELYMQVLAPAQVRVGELWHRDDISVAEEHLATYTAQSVMSRLRGRFELAAPNGRRMMAAAIAGELHDLGIRMVADFFEMDGWEALYVGANVPNRDLVRAVADFEVDLLAVSVTSVLNLRRCGELIDDVRAAGTLGQVKVMAGGAPFQSLPELWRELGADGGADSAEAAVALGNRLVPQPPARRVSG